MIYEQEVIHKLYGKLLGLYPRNFNEQLGESMEQTFRDLWNEKRQTKKELFGFVLWTFVDTAIGIFREHLLLISPGGVMQTILKNIGLPALISFLLILPFPIMEAINTRTSFYGEFPSVLFFVMWLNVFAVSLILLPIVRARRTGSQDMANPAQGNTLLINPWLTTLISVALFLAPGIFPLLNSIGWLSMERLFNGPNPEVAYPPGQILAFTLILFPIAAGIVAGGPIVRALRTGGSLFAYPIHLLIVLAISFLFASGVVGLIIDQWPCFMGVPNCD